MGDWIKKVDFEKISPDFPCGLEGFLPIKALVEGKCTQIPEKRGVYLILARSTQMPGFNADNPTFSDGEHKPKPVAELTAQWNPSSPVVYIGRAGASGKKSNLRQRLDQYFSWFSGNGHNHDGGRDIWQIDNPGDLLVAWRVTEDEEPANCEADLIQAFLTQCHKRPFANHRTEKPKNI